MAQHVIASTSKEELLAALLEKELAYYMAVLDLSRCQHEAFKSKRPLSEITPLMRKKKVLLSCVDEIELAIRPLKKYWLEKTDYSDALSVGVKKKISSLDRLVKEILGLEKACEDMLELYMLKLKS